MNKIKNNINNYGYEILCALYCVMMMVTAALMMVVK